MISENEFPNFPQRQKYISIKQFSNQGNEVKGANIIKLIKDIEENGLNPEDIFFANDYFSLDKMYYIRGSIWLDCSLLKQDIKTMKICIDEIEQNLNRIIARRDFMEFFKHVDKRLAVDLFFDLFTYIAVEEKYSIYKKIKEIDPEGVACLPNNFLSQVEKYKYVVPGYPVPDNRGNVTIFSSFDGDRNFRGTETEWSTSVNRAIERSLQHKYPIPIFRTRLPMNKIREFYPEGRQNHYIVIPSEIDYLKKCPFYTLDEVYMNIFDSNVQKEYYEFYDRINENWFVNPKGIHAISHTARVLFFTNILSVLESLTAEDRKILNYVAIYHDIGRQTDGYEPNHGVASYSKLKTLELELLLSQEDSQIVRLIIENHSIPDKVAQKAINNYDIINLSRARMLLGIFKDADALDRVRINDLDINFLRSQSSPRLMLSAYQLYKQAENSEIIFKR